LLDFFSPIEEVYLLWRKEGLVCVKLHKLLPKYKNTLLERRLEIVEKKEKYLLTLLFALRE